MLKIQFKMFTITISEKKCRMAIYIKFEALELRTNLKIN